MKIYKTLFLTTLLILLCAGYALAQQNLAQQAYAIFKQNCLGCHGQFGTFTEELVIEYTALIDTGVVLPGNPQDSEFYRRLLENAIEKPQMPLGQPPLPPEAIDTIRQWIEAGAPDWNAITPPDTPFITPDEMLAALENHVQSLDAFDREFARYFTLTHLYNAGESTDVRLAYQNALSKLVNSLSWGIEVMKPQAIDVRETLFYIDVRDYEWDIRNAWTQIEQHYPYHIEFHPETQASLHEKLSRLRQEMHCEIPVVHVDWFLATASLPPLYDAILDLPETDRALEERLEVNVAGNLRNAPGTRVWRAGFSESGVSTNNRVVERHVSRYGAYWKSYDFSGSVGNQNIFTHPLFFRHDGGEVVFNLPNGLQAYYLADASGHQLDEAPINIVSNPAASDPTVRNGLSCIGCHTEGMKTFKDEVRSVIQQAANPQYDKAHALRLYPIESVMDAYIEKDTQRYKQALERAGGVFGGIEPIQQFHEAFQGPVGAAHAAATVGLETADFLEKIHEDSRLQNLGLLVLTGTNGLVKRDAWTSRFQEVVSALIAPNTIIDTPVITPTNPDFTRDFVYIPDANLRAVIEDALGKKQGAPITAAEMATLPEHFYANVAGIRDLTGFEFAVNVKDIDMRANEITDISPLAELINLISLDVGDNLIFDLSPIARLTNLRTLTIDRNERITDFSPIQGLTHLKFFRSWGVNISDLSVFSTLPNLVLIDICGGEVSDLSPLASLTGLTELYFVHNNISDVSPLASLTGLERLNLAENEISDVSPLARLTNLKWLKLTENPISDFTPIDGLAAHTKIVPSGFVFSADTTRIKIGNTLTLHILAERVKDLSAWSCDITFNPDVLEVVEVSEGMFLKTAGATVFQQGAIDNTSGKITQAIGVLNLDGGVHGTGTLFSITFSAKALGESQVMLSNFELTDSDGEKLPSEPQEILIRVEECAGWDVNTDGRTNIIDLVIISRDIGVPSPNPRSDVNCDGQVNILDLVLVAQHLGNE